MGRRGTLVILIVIGLLSLLLYLNITSSCTFIQNSRDLWRICVRRVHYLPGDQGATDITDTHFADLELISVVKDDIFPDAVSPPQHHNTSCQEKREIAFAKTHKTGSTTLQNIFFRFGEQRGLTFALPKGQHIFHLNRRFQAKWAQSPEKNKFNIFASHSIWNYQEVEKIIPNSYKVTILREPVSCFESYFVYMGLGKKHTDINEFAETLKTGHGVWKPELEHKQLTDLGYSPGQSVRKKLEEMDSEFDQVLIMEELEAGLVIMAEDLCWSLEDVTFIPRNQRKKEFVSNITGESVAILESLLYKDIMLYKHFLQKHRREVERRGEERIEREVRRLKQRNDRLRSQCLGPETIRPESQAGSHEGTTSADTKTVNSETGHVDRGTRAWNSDTNAADFEPRTSERDTKSADGKTGVAESYTDTKPAKNDDLENPKHYRGSGNKNKEFIPQNRKVEALVPNTGKEWCSPYLRTEIAYTKILREKQDTALN